MEIVEEYETDEGYDNRGYYVATVNGATITFYSYEEYLEYIEAD